MTPAHHAALRRWAILAVVVAVLTGGAALTRSPGRASPGGPPVSPGAIVSAPDAESSAWYCTGQSTASGKIAAGTLILTDTTARAVSGVISAVTDSGATASSSVTVPAMRQIVASVPAPSAGTWVSYTVTLAGGGVAVTQAVQGSGGWSETPCQSGTSANWYFPSGTTAGTNVLFVALFNPTATPVVVDMSFVTPGGLVHPINFQGLVLQPGQTEVQNVSSYVQEQSRVSTAVTARAGRIVASELELLSTPGSGVAIVPGLPRTESQWTVPESLEINGGASSIDIFNPGPATEDVTVRARLNTGPLAPFTQRLLPNSTWALATNSQSRIPQGDAYSAVIDATGGPGVVVGRSVSAAGSAQSPQAGIANAVDGLSAAWPSEQWVLPGPGSPGSPILAGVLPAHVALSNVGTTTERYVVNVLTARGPREIASGTLDPSHFISLGVSILFGAGLRPLLVQASGPLAVSEDVGPSATIGVITMPGIPLRVALGS